MISVRLGNVSCSMFPSIKTSLFSRRDQSFRRGVDGSVNSVRLLLAGTAIDVEPASTEQEADNRSRARERRETDGREAPFQENSFLHGPLHHFHMQRDHQLFLCSVRTGHEELIVSHLPGGHLPPPNSDISHPPKKTFARRTTATPNFFLLFLAHFSWLFRLTAHGGHQGWEGGGA